MSYLVDALKKAERERYARSARDLHQAAAMDADARRGAGLGRWLFAGLVAMNVALVAYIWRPQLADTAQPSGASATAVPASPSAAAGETSQVARSGESPPAVTDDKTAAEPGGEIEAPAMPETPIVRDTVAAPAANPARTTAGGKVTYSTVPLADDAAPPAARDEAGESPNTLAADSVPAQATFGAQTDDLAAQADTSAPEITINGQLYSTVPGRSFILVDGRRYHEGERLAAGPAVEQIEPSGAVLRFQGQRYRVAGPG